MKMNRIVLHLLAAVAIGANSAACAAGDDALARAKKACAQNDFDGFLIQLAKSPALRAQFTAKTIEIVDEDARGPGKGQTSSQKIAKERFNAFPLAFVNQHYMRAPQPGAHGEPDFVSVHVERQTAILTDYPVNVVSASWRQIRYGAPPPGKFEGDVLGAYGDSGRLLFARRSDDCWELINVFTMRQSNDLRPPEKE